MAQHTLIPPPRANRSKAADEIDSTAIEPLSNEPIQAGAKRPQELMSSSCAPKC